MAFPSSSAGKESACNAEDPGLIPGLGRAPGGEHGKPLQYSFLENPLAGYSPWRGKKSDTTEWLSTAQTFIYYQMNYTISNKLSFKYFPPIHDSHLFLLLAVLGLHCCLWAFSSCGKQGLLFVVVCRLLIVVASLISEHGLYGAWVSMVVVQGV